MPGFTSESASSMAKYTETSYQSWGGRLSESIKGVLIGILLFFCAFPLIFWNEGRAVERARQLEDGLGAVVSIQAGQLLPENEGKLVHLTGQAVSNETLTDLDFKVETDALKLRRTVEMFQVQETKTTDTTDYGGGRRETTTTYEYQRVWSESLLDSSMYNEDGLRSAGIKERNPQTKPYESTTHEAGLIKVGAFDLSPALKNQLDVFMPLNVGKQHQAKLPKTLRKSAKLHRGMFYLARRPKKPRVGDVRIKFEVVRPSEGTIIAQQRGKSFGNYPIDGADPLEQMLRKGAVTAETIFGVEQESNEQLTWILRGVGFLMMSIGIFLLAGPLVAVAHLVPLVGDIVSMGAFIAAAALSLPFTIMTIAAGWLFYRPLIAIPLLAFGVGNIVLLFVLRRGKKAQAHG